MPTRRPGFSEQRLLTREASTAQNVIRIHAAEGAEVEEHPIATSESLYVLAGRFELVTSAGRTPLSVGDLAHCPPSSRHGLVCTQGPGELLVIWAPSTPA